MGIAIIILLSIILLMFLAFLIYIIIDIKDYENNEKKYNYLVTGKYIYKYKNETNISHFNIYLGLNYKLKNFNAYSNLKQETFKEFVRHFTSRRIEDLENFDHKIEYLHIGNIIYVGKE